ncbi:hypothetical protein [Desulfovibrio sp. ZJ200]|uniref:hypothetical protein n=1 Tax=Desulfovibrio sp. ZJ200 TaxID=2709792 RepID=UPI00197CD87F|nr:hypothetical protein [Desulfovibrio sp. ZJ200]
MSPHVAVVSGSGPGRPFSGTLPPRPAFYRDGRGTRLRFQRPEPGGRKKNGKPAAKNSTASSVPGSPASRHAGKDMPFSSTSSRRTRCTRDPAWFL